MVRHTMLRISAGVCAGLVTLAIAACATPPPGTDPIRAASAVATDPVLLTTGHPVTVIDDGRETALCLGGVLQSVPPGCAGGLTLVGWDWDDVPGPYEEANGVRWGDFVVTGTHDSDAEEFTVVSVTDGSDYAWPDPPEDAGLFPTRCAEPPRGWQILDEDTATLDALHAATALAAQLDGYATSWVDNALIPPVAEGTDPLDEMHNYAVNAGLTIINVAVRGDTSAAEDRLREVWGGALCVFSVDYTAAEREALLQEILAEQSDIVTAFTDGMTGRIKVSVAYDDGGALQDALDGRYGTDLVVVNSVLKPE